MAYDVILHHSEVCRLRHMLSYAGCHITSYVWHPSSSCQPSQLLGGCVIFGHISSYCIIGSHIERFTYYVILRHMRVQFRAGAFFFSSYVAILCNITSYFWPPQMQAKCCDHSGMEANTCSRGFIAS